MHEHFMQEALLEAAIATSRSEVPVGAVAVAENEIIAQAHNQREETGNPLDHAEILLLRKIVRDQGNWRFNDVTVYVTCEPCLMCMGALIHARIPRLVFGCFEPKTGACGSLYDFSRDTRLNHHIEVIPGVLHDQCAMQLREFFQRLRGQDLTPSPCYFETLASPSTIANVHPSANPPNCTRRFKR